MDLPRPTAVMLWPWEWPPPSVTALWGGGGRPLFHSPSSHWALTMPSAPAFLGVGLQGCLASQSLGTPSDPPAPIRLCQQPFHSCPSH